MYVSIGRCVVFSPHIIPISHNQPLELCGISNSDLSGVLRRWGGSEGVQSGPHMAVPRLRDPLHFSTAQFLQQGSNSLHSSLKGLIELFCRRHSISSQRRESSGGVKSSLSGVLSQNHKRQYICRIRLPHNRRPSNPAGWVPVTDANAKRNAGGRPVHHLSRCRMLNPRKKVQSHF